jgi:hypothetical protein
MLDEHLVVRSAANRIDSALEKVDCFWALKASRKSKCNLSAGYDAQSIKAFTFFATHFLELTRLADMYPNVEKYVPIKPEVTTSAAVQPIAWPRFFML